jgi:hypothetical protein
MTLLRECLSYDNAQMITESDEGGKNLYMRGIFVQGGVRNANKRVYPVHEIKKAVDVLNEQIKSGQSIFGEGDHPEDLKINIDRISHIIQEMWMDGPNGFGKLKVIDTPMGEIVKKIIGCGGKLGVSSRGSGNVNEASGDVSDFEMITVDIVAQPSAPNAYPTPIYEGMMNMKNGHKLLEVAGEIGKDYKAQKYLKESVIRLIKELKI